MTRYPDWQMPDDFYEKYADKWPDAFKRARYFAITKTMHAIELTPISAAEVEHLIAETGKDLISIPIHYTECPFQVWPKPAEGIIITRVVETE